jgi:23S rRNA (cytidine1920-2'-O)/16S rRNA (cytidine1409-2'-O)-methyltransferase
MSGRRRERVRADVLLEKRGLAPSRARAQASILAGEVFLEEQRIEKPGQLLLEDAPIRVVARRRFVSRGGDKLEAAIDAFGIHLPNIAGSVALDVGASTGGFTDCLLQRGARRVFAVDVGWGQLDGKLRSDVRVVSRERTNARDLTKDDFDEPVDLVVVDASFIGLDKLLPAIARVLAPGGWLIALIKPQFEVGREVASKSRGVIRDEGDRSRAIDTVLSSLPALGFEVVAGADSAVLGPKGNREHFVLARRVPHTSGGPRQGGGSGG